MNMSDRKKKILQIVVDEYINTAVPVSSKSIAEKHLTDVSSATVRNELASLEELGYLTQFHTSGGRVPSPMAYRFYIEELMQKGDLTEKDLDYIEHAFEGKSNDVEHLIKNVAKVISDLTDYTSVGIGPAAEEERIRKMSLLPCGEGRALLVIVTGTRILRDSFIDIPEAMSDEDLDNAGRTIAKLFEGRALSEAKDGHRGAQELRPPARRGRRPLGRGQNFQPSRIRGYRKRQKLPLRHFQQRPPRGDHLRRGRRDTDQREDRFGRG